MAEIIMAFAPLVFLIVYALKTRKMADAMILAALLAMVLLHRQHFLTGAIDALYGALSNSSYQFVLCITIGFGGMITLFQESGALMGFRDLLLAVGAFPKAGALKRAYRRVGVAGGGGLLPFQRSVSKRFTPRVMSQRAVSAYKIAIRARIRPRKAVVGISSASRKK